MTGIVERLRQYGQHYEVCNEAADEIGQMQTDKAAISQTASGYLHEIERLRTAIKEAADYWDTVVTKHAEIERLNKAYICRAEELTAARAEIKRLQDQLELARSKVP